LEGQVRELEEARKQVASLQEELARARNGSKQKEDAEEGRLQAHTRDLEAAKGQVVSLQEELVRARSGLAAKGAAEEELLRKRERDLEQAKRQVASLQEELASARAAAEEKAQFEKKLATAVDSNEEAERRLEELSKTSAQAESRVQELSKTTSEQEARLQRLSTQLAQAGQERKALEDRLRQAESQKADPALHQKLIDSLSDKDAELARLKGELAQARTVAVAPAPIPPEKRLVNLEFDEKNGVSLVKLQVAGKPEYRVVRKDDSELLLVLDDTSLHPILERTLDTSDFSGPVKAVSSYRSPTVPDTTIVSVLLDRPCSNRVVAQDGGVVWTFSPSGEAPVVADSGFGPSRPVKSRVAMYPEGVGSGGAQDEGMGGGGDVAPGVAPGGMSAGGDGAAANPFAVLNPKPGKKKKKYTGKRINLSIKDADIQHVLAFLARVGTVNIVTSEGVKGKVSFYLEDVPWDLALDMILKASGLDYIREQGIYRVAPVADIQEEYAIELEKKKKLTELKQLQVKLIPVNYADADELQKQVKGILSAKGSVSVDTRTNTLIVKDIEEHVTAIEDLIKRLDAQTPQVLVEARIVEASRDYSRDLGIQWGGYGLASSATGNATGLIFPSTIGVAGAASDTTSTSLGLFTPANPNFAVNMPAPAGQGAGGGLGLTLGSLGGAANLAIRLTAAEEEGSVKIISAPKISTIDNRKATIRQGISFPVSVVSAQGVNTQFFDAQLKMEVTPHVTQDGNIMLKVDITKNEPDFSQTGANGNPTIRKKEAHTTLLLRDGDTTVIGGIYTRNLSTTRSKVPFLADIPLLGVLFKSFGEVDKRSELLIFVTPRIVNRQASKIQTGEE
jgi:type IV pilus assembly protein PilQ